MEIDMLLSRIEGSTIFITGATGLIGKNLIKTILSYNNTASNPIKIVALVRDKSKAEIMFSDFDTDCILYEIGDISECKPINMNIDYIIHGASQTTSKAFVDYPVETINTAIDGTKNMLELARINNVKSFVYLSSMEVYGTPQTDEKIDETHSTNLNFMNPRSCYPVSKIMCESLCSSYSSEYGVPAKVVRLTQTFGLGVQYNDTRVFAQFARCAVEGRDIILQTKGDTKRCYLYTEDAVAAIMTVLINGTNGEAYNAANEDTYCSIYEMAELVANECSDKPVKVLVELAENAGSLGYAPTLKMNLDTRKLKSLGWYPKTSLKEMYLMMITEMKQFN